MCGRCRFLFHGWKLYSLIWLVVWVLWHINLCRLFNAKSIFKYSVLFQAIQFSETVLIQTIQFSIRMILLHTQLNVKTFPFQAFQFRISTQFKSQNSSSSSNSV